MRTPAGTRRARRGIGPRGARHNISATADTRPGALTLLDEKVAAFEAGQMVELTSTITLAAYLRWWLDTDLVEQVENGLIADRTRSSYESPAMGHIIEPLGSVRLHELSGGASEHGRRGYA